jgi:hypothetical protein
LSAIQVQISDESNCIPYDSREIQSLLVNAPFRWWITGGWALDLFLQEQTRRHFDVDVAISRQDQLVAQLYLKNWDFWSTMRNESGNIILRHWETGEILGTDFPGVWGRESPDAPWRFEYLLHEINEQLWIFRYSALVQHPLKNIEGFTPDGIPYLQPEIALLNKAARLRDVDMRDFHKVLPHLNGEQRSQLAGDLHKFEPAHPWLAALKIVT